MSPNLTLICNGKKFMWDGQVYENQEEASRATQLYRTDNFQIQIAEEGGKVLVYTRRTATQVVVPAQ